MAAPRHASKRHLYSAHNFGTVSSHNLGSRAIAAQRLTTTGVQMPRVHHQAAVVPYRIRNERLEVALVTTSRGKGWIVPKGSVDHGERPRDAAIREAEEEAGLRGIVTRKPIGRYHHVKGNLHRQVDVYLMRVTSVLDYWLEDKLRRRRWMRIPDAAACVREELQQFVHAIEGVVELDS